MASRRSTVASETGSKPVKSGRIRKVRSTVSPTAVLPKTINLNECSSIPVDGHPPAWAECRPDLCDALPWFRSVQGGVYHNGNICWGFLVDADCGIRSYMDNEIVITRVGGGCTKDANGNLVLIKDQDNDSCILSSILNSQKLNVPVGMILGDRNTLLGRKVPHRYNVMAYFRITDVWYERVGKKTGAKVRFEKLDLASKSWWAAKDSPVPVPLQQRNFDIRAEMSQCSSCFQTSPRIYNEGWMCLQPSCVRFWTVDGCDPPADLSFHPRFLTSRIPPDPGMEPQYNLVPNLLSTLDDGDGDASARIAWKGIVCPQCAKCISRRFWRGWKCTDKLTLAPMQMQNACTFEKIVKMSPVSLRSVVDDFELGPIKRTIFFDPKFAIPEIDDQSLYPYRKLTYKMNGVGYVTHLVSNKTINSRANGPNDIFKQLQVVDLGLRRYPLQQSVVAGTLTAHFAVNYGMPYKYVVSVDSKGFSEASNETLRAFSRLTWATEQAVIGNGDPFLPPNELLILGYFEDMRIGYHDDGESSLGPTIATLSLGARATMFLRMKYKHFHGFTKSKRLLDDDPVLEGCQNEGQRRILKDKFKKGEISQAAYDELRWEAFKKVKSGDAPPFIKMELNHGDLVVMHGENLQKYYEHSVIPERKLRFAVTARYIKPEHVDPKELKKGEFILAPDQRYDGK